MLPVSDSQVLGIWNKDLGDGYRYKIDIKVGGTVISRMQGTLSFGSTVAVVVNGLQPDQPYDFDVYHECASKPGTPSSIRNRNVRTLQQGKKRSRNQRMKFSLFTIYALHVQKG